MTRDSAIRAGLVLLAVLTLCSCEPSAEFYPLPAQRAAIADPDRWERIVHMTDADAQERFVADVFDPLAATWRWTGQRPLLRLNVPQLDRPARASLTYHIQFAIPEMTLQSTGPVTLTFLVNGRSLDHQQYRTTGEFLFEKAVPADWITGGETTLGAEIDKVFVAKDGARKYGFLLLSLGLKR